jgi:hypothetical protein
MRFITAAGYDAAPFGAKCKRFEKILPFGFLIVISNHFPQRGAVTTHVSKAFNFPAPSAAVRAPPDSNE